MGGRDDGGASGRPTITPPAPTGRRTALLVTGLALAVAATLAIFLTSDPTYLRVAVLAAAWAFGLAAFAAGRRRTDQVAAAAREAELRRGYERELEREEETHRQIELELENDLRRDVQERQQRGLEALRHDVAAIGALRRELGALSNLHTQLAALPALRDELARVSMLRADVDALGSLRDEVEALARLRAELGSLADVRAELGRLRSEITEQLSGELLVERIVMRTQGVRPAAESPDAPTRDRDVEAPAWGLEPPRELTGGRPAVRLDEALGTREYERVRADEPWRASAQRWSASAEPAVEEVRPLSPVDWLVSRSVIDPATDLRPRRSRHAAAPAPEPAPTPSMPTPEPTPTPEPMSRVVDAEAITEERPRPHPLPPYERVIEPHENARRDPHGSQPHPAPSAPATQAVPALQGEQAERPARQHVYVQDLLAEQATPPSGGRRRRRYRDENTEDDVLSRILGRS